MVLGDNKGKLRKELNLSNVSFLPMLQVSTSSNVLLIFCNFIDGKFGWWRKGTGIRVMPGGTLE